MFRFVLRLAFFAAGLVFAGAVLAAVMVVAALWGARAVWARITGKPVTPWVMRMDPRAGFRRFNEAARAPEPEPTGAERAAERARSIVQDDVEDVKPRDIGPRG
ncbi:MAG: hypothetical protein EOP93_18965 [Lysobacteraceae bacterium]|nr:MAG: hypothetical protein EOP93_18965 [Xanthomonadaceae bacterium]